MSPPQFALEVRPEVGPAGTYLLTAIPYQTDSGGDYVAREDAQALTGLLRSTLGENIAFEPLSEFGFSPETNLQKGFSESVRRPARDQNPDLSRIEFSQRAYTALWKLGRHERNRVKLSLRWHERAQRARGVDSFINQWIALEALGMEKQDNLRPLEETLARVYGTSRDDARQRFGLNLIFGLRGETLHKGVVPVYRSDLEDDLRALYQDLLSARLGLPSDKRAEAILERDGFDLNDLLRSARQEPANPDWAKG